MSVQILVLLSFLVTKSWAGDYQPILTQITAGNSDCNSEDLLGDFDLETVPQFNALCNIPIPDSKQAGFLLENNVVPILCVGLLDVSLRLCRSAKNDISRFRDIFPPTNSKFNEIFFKLSNTKDFSSIDEFCSTTVKKFAIKEATTNATEFWWQVLNKQLSDKKNCSSICHSNDGSKVHPLCSYILWSNGVYILNYQNNQVDEKTTTVGEQEPPVVQKLKEVVAANQAGKADQDIGSIVNNELETKPTELISSDSLGGKIETGEGTKSNFTTDNNSVGVGTVEQVGPSGDLVTDTIKTEANPSVDQVKLAKKDDKTKSKHHKIKEAITTIKPTGSGSSKGEADGVIQEKSGVPAVPAEVKVNPNGSTATVPSKHPEPQVVPDPQKPSLAGEGMVEGDFSLEMTPDALDQPIAASKDFQPPPYTDEEGEDGDGDDVDIMESNAANTNTVNNSSNTAASKVGEASIQQGPLEGDKVYGEGEILIEDHFIEAEDSHFFTYFLCMAVLTIMAYLAFHNKKKLIALAVEGRRTKGVRRRPNSSHYSKLDCSLEEALVSNTTASVTHVLY